MTGVSEPPLEDVPTGDTVQVGREKGVARKLPDTPSVEKAGRRGDAPWVRTVACLCFEVNGPEPDPRQWRPGPFPVRLPDGHIADQEARSTYFHARAADCLYGPPDGSSPTRWHRTDEPWPDEIGSVHGIELLRFPRYASALQSETRGRAGDDQAIRYLAVIHLSLPTAQLLSELAAAVRIDPLSGAGAARRQLYTQLIGAGFEIPSQVRRALSVIMLTWKNEPAWPEGAPTEWTPTTGWLWCGASATPLSDVCPDTDDPHLLDGIVYLSTSWRALVLRDGIAFLGLQPDLRANERDFFAWGESYVRSLYLDVILLATLERDALDDFSDRLACVGNRFEKSVEFRSLVNEVTEFRNVFWWEHVTSHHIANNIFRKLHNAHRTPQVFDRVIADLDAFRQQVEAQALEASLTLQVAEERRSRKFEHAASIAAFAFGLPVLIFAGLALPIRGLTSGNHDIPGWAVIVIALAAITIGAVAGAAGNWWLASKRQNMKPGSVTY